MKLANRTILITGGTSGIGLALATRLLALGNTVIITGRDKAKLEKVQASLPTIHIFQSDISNASAIENLYDAIIASFPDLDVLINNAGIMRNLNLNDSHDLIDITREIETNLSGPVRMIQQFLPHLKSRADAIIINVSSGLAFVPFPLSPIYSAAKAALHAYTRTLRIQLTRTSVKVVELLPPMTETPQLRQGEFKEEMKDTKAMDVNELVETTISGIESGKLEIRPGLSSLLKIMSRIAPEFALHQIAKTVRSTTAK